MTEALLKHPDPSFTSTPACSRRIKAVKIADTEFADDIPTVALLVNYIQGVQELLCTVETEAAKVRLRMN